MEVFYSTGFVISTLTSISGDILPACLNSVNINDNEAFWAAGVYLNFSHIIFQHSIIYDNIALTPSQNGEGIGVADASSIWFLSSTITDNIEFQNGGDDLIGAQFINSIIGAEVPITIGEPSNIISLD